MKKQSGFTLIELLLVLAIIGIISAIAIPALLGQRSRARDKAATQNMTGVVGDLVGAWDKAKEAGGSSTSCKTAMETVLSQLNLKGNKNPWKGGNAYNPTIGASSSAIGATTGYVEFALVTGASPLLVGAVKVKNSINGSLVVRKKTNLE